MASGEGTLNVLLGAGGLAFVAAVFKGIKELRESGWKRRGSDISRLERYVRESDEKVARAEFDEDFQARLANYWFTYSGKLTYLLNVHNIAVPPPDDQPIKPDYVPAGDDSK